MIALCGFPMNLMQEEPVQASASAWASLPSNCGMLELMKKLVHSACICLLPPEFSSNMRMQFDVEGAPSQLNRLVSPTCLNRANSVELLQREGKIAQA